MTDYDPNLPQEFAHMPKRNGFRTVMLIMTLVVVFALGALFAALHHQTPASETVADAPTAAQPETSVETPAPPVDTPAP